MERQAERQAESRLRREGTEGASVSALQMGGATALGRPGGLPLWCARRQDTLSLGTQPISCCVMEMAAPSAGMLSVLAVVAVLVALETGAQACLQKGIQTRQMLIPGIILYAMVGAVYFRLLIRGEKLAVANALFNAGTVVSITLMGVFMFGQKLTAAEWGGVGLSLGSVVFLLR
jgi:multidrug transporter EmrE-like cation transporter